MRFFVYSILVYSLLAPGLAQGAPQFLYLPAEASRPQAAATQETPAQSVKSSAYTLSAGATPEFELVFPELQEGANSGFGDPLLGEQRRAIAQRVFEQVSQLLDGEPGRARIRLDSRSPWLDDRTLAVGIPYFRCVDGFQKPIIFDALRENQHVHEVEGELLVNFELPIHASLEAPPSGHYDLYTLLLHEAMHVLGFVGFSVEADGRPGDCGGARMLPAIAAHATDALGRRLWVERDGAIHFDGAPADLPDGVHAMRLDDGLAIEAPLRLAADRLRVSGHWLPEDFPNRPGVLMLRAPFPSGQLRRNLTPETKTVLAEVLGYRVGQELRGLTGSWVDPALDGQGLTLHFITPDRFAVYFFGYAANGERLWLVGLHDGAFELGEALDIDLFEATGGRFGNGTGQTPVELPWGDLSLRFTDCHSAVAGLSGMDGTQDLQLVPLARVDSPACF